MKTNSRDPYFRDGLNVGATSDNKQVAQPGSKLAETSSASANSVICDSYGAQLIAAERARQISEEGYTAESDDRQTAGQLGMAASCYALPPTLRDEPLPMLWPWSGMVWRPSPSRIRELVKAGALIAAEIDRVRRAEGRG
jgi:hypothetical protein